MGSPNSGEPLISGDTNAANTRTYIVADNGNFLDVVFLVVPHGDFSHGPEGDTPVHGILGIGYQGGAGVMGRGDSTDQFRPGQYGRGTGGHGVVGKGGSGAADSNTMETYHPERHGKFKPGAGVIGLGGYWIGDAKGRGRRGNIGGPGVVGLGGGNESEEPYDLAAYHADFDKVGAGNVAGVGVVGRTKYEAAGGLFESSNGYGVVATGKLAGGFFQSPSAPRITAQIHLHPQIMSVPEEVSMPIVGNVNPAKVDQLPRIGNLGDLLLTTGPDNANYGALLWLCTRAGGQEDYPADWRQVLLGPPIPGRK
jgi:hypothetical protein